MAGSRNIEITALGAGEIKSPLTLSTVYGDGIGDFVPEEAAVRYQVEINTIHDVPDILFEKAGPRERIFFKPSDVRAAVVTCGGLCPGLNNVIRSITLELHHNYGVTDIRGLRYGFRGLNPDVAHAPIRLTPDSVDNIHRQGGTVLGTSRGMQDVALMVRYLDDSGINMLFCVGGDGTQRGAHAIARETLRRKLEIAVVGIPKTIDNDILYVRRTFGFGTAIDKAREVLDGAHNEARGALNGIGLVKVMGRDSGFIAAVAALASQEANFVLIPEVPFALEGKKGFLHVLRRRIEARGHAVIVVSEGAGQDLLPESEAVHDASGNKLYKDVGQFLQGAIKKHFAEQDMPVNLKYINPSYIIRSMPANSEDSLLCDQFARHAIHAAMAGKTDLLTGYWGDSFIHVPIEMAVKDRHRVAPESDLWNSVIAATGQPRIWQ